MPKPAVRGGVYSPPVSGLPYIGLIITPQGETKIKTFSSEKDAQEFVEKKQRNYVEQLSVIGKGNRDSTPKPDK